MKKKERIISLILLLLGSLQSTVMESKAIPFRKGSKSAEQTTTESQGKRNEDTNTASKVSVNDKAPDLALPDQSGKIVTLKEFLGKKVVVLYFYPKDNTSVCTAEACSFRDSYESFKDLGAEVIGVSSDSVESHKGFAEKHHLPFPLLADKSGMVRKAFGVPNTARLIPGRVTYVIDKDGVVRYTFNSMMDGSKHVTEAMRIVKDLNGSAPKQ